jgi:signal peptidase I
MITSTRTWFKKNRNFLIVIAVLLFVRAAIANQYIVPSGSMLPTIQIGDRLFVNRLAYDFKIPLTHISLAKLGNPERGDIIVFDSPENAGGVVMVKRLVGMPGDQIELRNGELYLNGARFDADPFHNDISFTVPPNHYFMMGDNRNNSADSRAWGLLPRENMIGRSKRVLYSANFMEFSVNWNRFGKKLD